MKFGKKKSEKSRDALAVKAGFWYTVGNFVKKGLVFIATPIFTRIMTKAEYGNYSNFTTWQELFAILLTLELHTSVNKARLEFKDEMKEYLSSIVVTGTCFTFFCYLVVLLFRSRFEALLDMPMSYINIMFCYLFFSPALHMYQVMNRVNLRYKRAITITICGAAVSLSSALVMTTFFEDRVFGRALGYDLVWILINGTIWVILLAQGRTVKKKYVSYALTYSVPLIAHLLSMYILGSSDKIMIKKLRGAEEVAIYAVGYSCAMIVTILMDSVNQAMSPWLFDNLVTDSREKIRKTNKIYIAGFCIVINAIMLLAPEVLYIMGGKKYAEARYVLPPVLIGCVARFLYTNYVNLEYYQKKTKMIAVGTVMAAVTNIILNFIFIPKFGYLAAAYTTWFSYVCLLVFHFFGSRRIGFANLYDDRHIFGWMLLETVLMLICTMIYRNDVIRYIVAGIYLTALLVGVYIFRDKVKKVIRLLI